MNVQVGDVQYERSLRLLGYRRNTRLGSSKARIPCKCLVFAKWQKLQKLGFFGLPKKDLRVKWPFFFYGNNFIEKMALYDPRQYINVSLATLGWVLLLTILEMNVYS